MSTRVARCGLGALLTMGLACASLAPRPVSDPISRGAPAADGATEQHLFRLTFDGGDGRVSLRVVLRTTSTERYQIAVSDVAGRKVWGLDFSATRAVLVDHREKMFCVSGPDLRLADVHPEELPLGALPRVLRGELPVAMTAEAIAATARDGGYRDGPGRVWRATHEGGVLVAWTLLTEDGPSVWWARQERGGILSRRGGQQYRWTQIVSEPAAGELPDPVPDGFAEGVCSE